MGLVTASGPAAQATTSAAVPQIRASLAGLELKSVPGAELVHNAAKPNAVGIAVTIYSRYSVTTNQCLDADIKGNGGGTNRTTVQLWTRSFQSQQWWQTSPDAYAHQ